MYEASVHDFNGGGCQTAVRGLVDEGVKAGAKAGVGRCGGLEYVVGTGEREPTHVGKLVCFLLKPVDTRIFAEMLCPVRCFSCGRVLADKYLYFDRKRNEKLAALKVNSASDKPFDARSVAVGDVLDKLGLTLYCCRSTLMTAVDLMDVI